MKFEYSVCCFIKVKKEKEFSSYSFDRNKSIIIAVNYRLLGFNNRVYV